MFDAQFSQRRKILIASLLVLLAAVLVLVGCSPPPPAPQESGPTDPPTTTTSVTPSSTTPKEEPEPGFEGLVGQTWQASTFGEAYQENFRVAATDRAYFAYGEGDLIWQSEDGIIWTQLSPIVSFRQGNAGWIEDPAGNLFISKLVGFPDGLIALGGSRFQRGRHPHER